MNTLVYKRRVIIESVEVPSIEKEIPIMISISFDGVYLRFAATRFGWTNKLVESIGTKQDLSAETFKDVQDIGIRKIKDFVSNLNHEEINTFIDESQPSKISVKYNVEERDW